MDGTSVAAASFADAGKALPADKMQALIAVKRVAAQIGLKPADLVVLDTLAAFSQRQDWAAGQSALVWPSNATLMAQTGLTLSSLKRHLRRLGAAGLIAFRDSANGKRWGRRAPNGVIQEAYGFDLSPLAARVAEFEALHQQIRAERDLCQRLKRQITIARRSIRAVIAQGAQADMRAAFDALLTRLPRKAVPSDELETLLNRFQALLARLTETTELDPRGAGNDPHIQTTNQLQKVEKNSSDPEEDTHVTKHGTEQRESKRSLSLDQVGQACPEFGIWAQHMGQGMTTLPGALRVAAMLCPMIGISERLWQRALEVLGPLRAVASVALVFDKHTGGQVNQPAAYLQGLLTRAGEGRLNLERSLAVG